MEKSWLNWEGDYWCVLNDILQAFQVTFLGNLQHLCGCHGNCLGFRGCSLGRVLSTPGDSFSRDTHPLWCHLCWIFLAEELTQWGTLCIDMWNVLLLCLGRLPMKVEFFFFFWKYFLSLGSTEKAIVHYGGHHLTSHFWSFFTLTDSEWPLNIFQAPSVFPDPLCCSWPHITGDWGACAEWWELCGKGRAPPSAASEQWVGLEGWDCGTGTLNWTCARPPLLSQAPCSNSQHSSWSVKLSSPICVKTPNSYLVIFNHSNCRERKKIVKK